MESGAVELTLYEMACLDLRQDKGGLGEIAILESNTLQIGFHKGCFAEDHILTGAIL